MGPSAWTGDVPTIYADASASFFIYGINGAVAIYGGCSPEEFMEKIQMIQEVIGPYNPEDDEEDD